ncbi:MAG: integration host factor, actinobacterial type [Actinomycetota bacterium]|nr:integration host factor, actinobacterial type [Actinomycetota bacterium]
MPVNNLNSEVRRKGLVKAREIRKKRSDLKKALKSEKISLKSVFEDKDFFEQVVGNMKAIELVSALPGIGRVRAENILTEELKDKPVQEIGGLGKNQKQRFYNYFRIRD